MDTYSGSPIYSPISKQRYTTFRTSSLKVVSLSEKDTTFY